MDSPHWSEQYIGKRWIRGQYECTDLAFDILVNQFQKWSNVDRALYESRYRPWRKISTEEVQSLLREYMTPIDTPSDGDLLLMKIRGNKSDFGSHVGVVVYVDGARWIIHNKEGSGVVFHPEAHLSRQFLEPEGYYQWKISN